MAFYRVRCDRCTREQLLGSEQSVNKLAEAMRVFAFDSIDAAKIDDERAASIMAYCAGFVVVGDNVHKCKTCREVREVDRGDAR